MCSKCSDDQIEDFDTIFDEFQSCAGYDLKEFIEDNESINEEFKNLRWTWVITLSDYKEMAHHIYSMSDDIIYGL